MIGAPAPTWRTLPLPSGDPGPQPLAQGLYRIATGINGNVLEPVDRSTAAGSSVGTTPGPSARCPEWTVSARADGAYTITHATGDRSLSVRDCSAVDGTPASVAAPSGTSCDGWTFDEVDGRRYRLQSALTGKALEVPGCSSEDHVEAGTWPYWGELHGCRLWTPLPVE